LESQNDINASRGVQGRLVYKRVFGSL
jgi:hypothetical protein